MGELAKVAEALSAPATKLIEVVSRGIGRAYDPRYKKRMADASAYEIDTLSEAVRRNSDLPIFLDRDGIQLDARSIQELADRTKTRLFSQEMRKQQNIEAIVDKAYEEIQKETEVSNEPVDDDWITRFFNCVEDISSDKLREIWGKILAGEIKKPNSFPFRTLEMLKNLSLAEANLIEKLSFCLIYIGRRALIPNVREIWDEFNIEFDDLVALCNIGILNITKMSLKLNIKENKTPIYNEQIVGIVEPSPNDSCDTLDLNIYSLTESGRDIVKVVSKDAQKSEMFAIRYLSILRRDNKKCFFQAYRFVGVQGEFIHHEKTNLLPD